VLHQLLTDTCPCSTPSACRKLEQAATAASSYQPPAAANFITIASSCEAGLSKLCQFDTNAGIGALRTNKVCNEHGVPFKSLPLIQGLKVASMTYAECFMAASMQQVTKLELQEQAEAAAREKKQQQKGWKVKQASCQQRQQKVLSDAVMFVHRVHMFAGGLSEAAAAAFERLCGVMQQVDDGCFAIIASDAAAA
jgi:hypothetical protein